MSRAMRRPTTSSARIEGSRASTTPTSARKRTPRSDSRRSAKRTRCCAIPRSAPRTTSSASVRPARSSVRHRTGISTSTGRGSPRAMHSDFFEQLFGGLGGLRGGAGRAGRGDSAAAGSTRTAQVDVTLEEAFHGTTRTLSLQRVERQGRRARAARPATASEDPSRRRRRPADPRAGTGRARQRAAKRPATCSCSSSCCRTVGSASKGATFGSTCPWRRGKPRSARRSACRRSRAGWTSRFRRARRRIASLRLKERGLPGRPAGDQFVVLKIVVPAADSEAREALYKQMAAAMAMNPRAAMEDGR